MDHHGFPGELFAFFTRYFHFQVTTVGSSRLGAAV